MTHESQAEARRKAMPDTTEMLAQARQYFPDATVKWAREGNFTFRKPGPEGVAASDSRKGLERKRAT